MLLELSQELYDHGAEGDDDAYDWDTDEWHIWNQEPATVHDSIQVPASATGHEEAWGAATGQEEAPTSATGHEEARAMATGHEEARASATGQEEAGQRRKGDKPLLDPLEIDEEGLIGDTDEVAGWIPGTFPSIFQNEKGDPYNFKLAKPDLLTWGPHVLRSRGWAAQANMAFMRWWMNRCQRIKALSAKKWFIKDNPKATGCTAAIIKKIDRYTQKMPGTRGSKIRLRKIIVAMVWQMKIETHRPPD